MENTILNKSKFFAQYWWQEVFILNDKKYNITKSRFNLDTLKRNCYLELTPLSMISDEDAVKLPHKEYDNNKVFYKSANDFLENIKVFGFFTSDEADKLRELGYAIDFNGLSVEQLVEYGWVKLTPSKGIE